MAGVGRWTRQAKNARRISIVLGLGLIAIGMMALAATVRLDTATAAADSSGTLADLYQDARYFSSVETRELDAYRLDPSAETKQAQVDATAALDRTLLDIRRLGPVSESFRGVLLDQDWYESSARLLMTLVDSHQADAAEHLDEVEVDPVGDRIEASLGALEESSHRSAVASLRQSTLLGHRLLFSTPGVIGLAVLLLGLTILANRAYRRTIERQALEDPLTELPNRTVFVDRAVQALVAAPRTGADPVVMVLDLDSFKEVNDTLGHLVGDHVLIEVAARLSRVMRAGDTVARLGGDEFAILMTDGGALAGQSLANRIALALEAPFLLDGVSLGMEASIGIAARRGLWTLRVVA